MIFRLVISFDVALLLRVICALVCNVFCLGTAFLPALLTLACLYNVEKIQHVTLTQTHHSDGTTLNFTPFLCIMLKLGFTHTHTHTHTRTHTHSCASTHTPVLRPPLHPHPTHKPVTERCWMHKMTVTATRPSDVMPGIIVTAT